MLEPDLKNHAARPLRLAAIVFAISTITGVYFASQLSWAYPPSVRVSWPEAVKINLGYYWAWGLAVPLVLAVARRFRFSAPRAGTAITVHLLASVAITLVQLAVASGALIALEVRQSGQMPMLSDAVRTNFHSSYPTYWLIVLAFYAWDYFRDSRLHALRAAEVSSRLARAELDALRSQLDPHFLFNTLNSISSLMYTDVDAADRMMTQLGDLLRAAIDRSGDQEVPFRDELAILSRYVDIEKIRFEERLAVEFQVTPEALEASVPPLLLQPLLENAIRHGVGNRPEGGRLDVAARVSDGSLYIRIADDGVGSASVEERVGLGNTRARLQALYGDRASLRLGANAGGGMVAEIVMPYRRVTT